MLWRQGRPRLLWNVLIDLQVTNERVAGFLTPNPVRVPEDAAGAIFQVRVIQNDRVTNAVRVYGALSNSGFPGLAAGTEALWFKVPGPGAFGIGQLRQPAPQTVNATKKAMRVLPPWLLLEYTTAAPGVNTNTAQFVVDVTWLSPPIAGVC